LEELLEDNSVNPKKFLEIFKTIVVSQKDVTTKNRMDWLKVIFLVNRMDLSNSGWCEQNESSGIKGTKEGCPDTTLCGGMGTLRDCQNAITEFLVNLEL
jgi:hypothetical protein